MAEEPDDEFFAIEPEGDADPPPVRQPPRGQYTPTRPEPMDEGPEPSARVSPKKPLRTPTRAEGEAEDDTTAFRPAQRPPMALLCILDDGQEEGEWVRIRQTPLVIGRSKGDIIIPHDSGISSKHVEFTRELKEGRFRWYLTDLKSTNGTFVRVQHVHLKSGLEFLLGNRRFRFETPLAGVQEAESELTQGTRGWQSPGKALLAPSLVELTALMGEARRVPLEKKEYSLGRDAEANLVVIADDPLISPRHARLCVDAKGRWNLEDNKSRNGVWIRINRLPIEASCQFQLGEQRFILKPF